MALKLSPFLFIAALGIPLCPSAGMTKHLLPLPVPRNTCWTWSLAVHSVRALLSNTSPSSHLPPSLFLPVARPFGRQVEVILQPPPAFHVTWTISRLNAIFTSIWFVWKTLVLCYFRDCTINIPLGCRSVDFLFLTQQFLNYASVELKFQWEPATKVSVVK